MRWEYKTVLVEFGETAPGSGGEFLADGRILDEELARLGGDEWELVATHAADEPDPGATIYVFKRPLRS